jgi:hypothetical protein
LRKIRKELCLNFKFYQAKEQFDVLYESTIEKVKDDKDSLIEAYRQKGKMMQSFGDIYNHQLFLESHLHLVEGESTKNAIKFRFATIHSFKINIDFEKCFNQTLKFIEDFSE